MPNQLALHNISSTGNNSLNYTKQEILLEKIQEIKKFIKSSFINRDNLKNNCSEIKRYILNHIDNTELNDNTSVFAVYNTRSQTYLYIAFYALIHKNYFKMDYNNFISFYNNFDIDLNNFKTKEYFNEINNHEILTSSSNNIFCKKHNSYDLNLIKKAILELYTDQFSNSSIKDIKRDFEERENIKMNNKGLANMVKTYANSSSNYFDLFKIFSIKKIEELCNTIDGSSNIDDSWHSRIFILMNQDIRKGIIFGLENRLISKEQLEKLEFNQIKLLNEKFFELIKDGYYSFENLIKNVSVTSALTSKDFDNYINKINTVENIKQIVSEIEEEALKKINPKFLKSSSPSQEITKEYIKQFLDVNKFLQFTYIDPLKKAILLTQLEEIGDGRQIKIYLQKFPIISYSDFIEQMKLMDNFEEEKRLLFYAIDPSLYNSAEELGNILHQFNIHDIKFLKQQFSKQLLQLYLKKKLNYIMIGTFFNDSSSLKELRNILDYYPNLANALIDDSYTSCNGRSASIIDEETQENDLELQKKSSTASLVTRSSFSSIEELPSNFNEKLVTIIKKYPGLLLSQGIKTLVEIGIPINQLIDLNDKYLVIFANTNFISNILEIFSHELFNIALLKRLQMISIEKLQLLSEKKMNGEDYKRILAGYQIDDFFAMKNEELSMILSSYQQEMYKHFGITAKHLMQYFAKHQHISNNIPLVSYLIKNNGLLSNNRQGLHFRTRLELLLSQDIKKVELLTSETATNYYKLFGINYSCLIKSSHEKLKALFSIEGVKIGKQLIEMAPTSYTSNLLENVEDKKLQLLIHAFTYQPELINLNIVKCLIKIDNNKLLLLLSNNGLKYIIQTQLHQDLKMFEDFCNFDLSRINTILNPKIIILIEHGFNHEFLVNLSEARLSILLNDHFINYIEANKNDEKLLNYIKKIFNDAEHIDNETLKYLTNEKATKAYSEGIANLQEFVEMKNRYFFSKPLKSSEERLNKLRLTFDKDNFDHIYLKCQDEMIRGGRKTSLHSFSFKELSKINRK